MTPRTLADVSGLLGAPHMTLLWEDLERFHGPIIYVWTRADEVLYLGQSVNGLERPIATET